MTPEGAREAVEKHGGIRPAARALGVSPSTVWRWLHIDTARRREIERKHRARRRAEVRDREAAYARRRRYTLRSSGLCTSCGRERLLSETLCWTCLNRMESKYYERKGKDLARP